MMVLMASTWDLLGGQMGYNSLGNIAFFGIGMYVSAIVQVSIFYPGGVAEYTSAMGSIKPEFTTSQYYYGIFFIDEYIAFYIGCEIDRYNVFKLGFTCNRFPS